MGYTVLAYFIRLVSMIHFNYKATPNNMILTNHSCHLKGVELVYLIILGPHHATSQHYYNIVINSLRGGNMCTREYTYAHTRIHTHTHTHTHKHTYPHTHLPTQTHTQTHITQTHAHTHMCVHTHMHNTDFLDKGNFKKPGTHQPTCWLAPGLIIA